MLRAHATYEEDYLLGTSIARPIIAKHQVEVAHETGADAVGHGATGKGNDQVRFELTYMALDPRLEIVAPGRTRTFELTDREAAIDYAKAKGVPMEQTKEKIYSRDRNLWHISHEGADLEDPANEPQDHLWVMSVPDLPRPRTSRSTWRWVRDGQPVSALTARGSPGQQLIAA